MSFNRQVKHELVRWRELADCCCAWELAALVLLRGYLTLRDGNQILSILVDYNALARHVFRLLKKAGMEKPVVLKKKESRFGKNRYLVLVSGADQVDALLVYLHLREAGQKTCLTREAGHLPQQRCCARAFIRGAFLAGGSVSISGRSGYHLEINCSYQEDALALQECLAIFNLQPSLRQYNGFHSLYLKKGDAIADFLRVIGADSALLDMEAARVVKSMRNHVNRLVNCDTANLDKVIASAQQQLAIIDRLDYLVGLNRLPPSLQEAAWLRKQYPEASLKELGEMLDPPVGKSGMNHRFRQMERIVKERERKGAGGQPAGL
ncbi:MAG: DNA-binding protein WhiA [Firmicutes bacterium]|jgi:DNA-binding protein WhiA|nr:DNA-binding protein WhiA [Bacillota bacterium]